MYTYTRAHTRLALPMLQGSDLEGEPAMNTIRKFTEGWDLQYSTLGALEADGAQESAFSTSLSSVSERERLWMVQWRDMITAGKGFCLCVHECMSTSTCAWESDVLTGALFAGKVAPCQEVATAFGYQPKESRLS